tara:strand:- start:6147 stop:6914 length:768 start_codon:yes stop_codon:yes gene_type:complete
MTTVGYMSDLHLEFDQGQFMPDVGGYDVLVLAGDVHTKGRMGWANKMAQHNGHVVFVPGNHEFYQGDLTATSEKLRDNAAENVHVLENQSVELEGVWFHGATLWTDMNHKDFFTMQEVGHSMNDFRVVRTNRYDRRFTPEWAATLHAYSVEFLRASVNPGDVVVTHHAPTFASVHEKYRGSNLNYGYASDLTGVMYENRPALWVHGHVHNSFEYEVDGTLVVCNPRGYVRNRGDFPDYMDANPDFDPTKVFEVSP